jgi:phage terminase large subunit
MNNATFNKIFQSANETRHRYRVMLGSAGSGKSVNIAQDYIVKLSDPQYINVNIKMTKKLKIKMYKNEHKRK